MCFCRLYVGGRIRPPGGSLIPPSSNETDFSCGVRRGEDWSGTSINLRIRLIVSVT